MLHRHESKVLGNLGQEFFGRRQLCWNWPHVKQEPNHFQKDSGSRDSFRPSRSHCPMSLLSLWQPQEQQAQLSSALPLALGPVGAPRPYPALP